MKKLIFILYFIILSVPISAGPFITINSVDTQSDYPAVSAEITVKTPDGKDVTDLTEDHIRVYEDGYLVSHFRIKDLHGSEDYLYLVFSIDTSRSISEQQINTIKSSAVSIADSAGADDKIAVYRFNSQSILLNNFTSKRQIVYDSIGSTQRVGGKTLLYDAIYDSIELLSRVDRKKNRAVIVFTDGKDTGSVLKDSDIIKRSSETGVPVFFIATEGSDTDSIARIAKLTGGDLVYTRETEKIDNMYRSVLSALNNRYIVEYITMFRPDKKLRQLEIRLSYNNIKDRDTFDFRIKAPAILDIYVDKNSIFVAGIALIVLLMFVILILIITRSRSRVMRQLSGVRKPPEIKRTGYYQDEVADDEYDEEEAGFTREEEEDDAGKYGDAWLVVKGTAAAGKHLIDRGEITIGSSDECRIVIKDGGLSPRHAKIKKVDSSYYLFDMISDKGTYLNGSKLLRPKPLFDWDEIRTGKTTIIFRGRGAV